MHTFIKTICQNYRQKKQCHNSRQDRNARSLPTSDGLSSKRTALIITFAQNDSYYCHKFSEVWGKESRKVLSRSSTGTVLVPTIAIIYQKLVCLSGTFSTNSNNNLEK